MLRAVFTVHSGIEDLDTEAILSIADISDALDLEGAEKLVEAMDREVRLKWFKEQRAVKALENKLSMLQKANTEVPASLEREIEEAQEAFAELPQGVSYDELLQAEEIEYEVESSRLEWLSDLFKNFVWNQTLQRDERGQTKAVKKTLSTGEARTAASLVRAVKKAI